MYGLLRLLSSAPALEEGICFSGYVLLRERTDWMISDSGLMMEELTLWMNSKRAGKAQED